MHRFTASGLPLAALLFATLLPTSSAAVPLQVTQQGRLVDADGDPLTGSHTIHFSLYASDDGTGQQWTESQTVELDEGYYSVVLGSATGTVLDGSILSLQPLFLGMAVDSVVLGVKNRDELMACLGGAEQGPLDPNQVTEIDALHLIRP